MAICKVKIDQANFDRLMKGEQVRINLPPNCTQVLITVDNSADVRRRLAAKLSKVGVSVTGFDAIYEDIFGR